MSNEGPRESRERRAKNTEVEAPAFRRDKTQRATLMRSGSTELGDSHQRGQK